MLIEVLYIPGCCNHALVVEHVRKILRSEGMKVTIVEVLVKDEIAASSLNFPGSPTDRINGMDIEPISQARSAFACRLYSDGGGIPSETALRRAISAAMNQEGGHDSDHIIR
jgi:hypothetical protein